jgi:hypothetical protein
VLSSNKLSQHFITIQAQSTVLSRNSYHAISPCDAFAYVVTIYSMERNSLGLEHSLFYSYYNCTIKYKTKSETKRQARYCQSIQNKNKNINSCSPIFYTHILPNFIRPYHMDHIDNQINQNALETQLKR